MWTAMDCGARGGMTLESLKTVVFAIMGLPAEKSPDPSGIELIQLCKPTIGDYVDNKTYVLSAEEARQFRDEFSQLYLNKMAAHQPAKVGTPGKTQPEFSHRPKLTQTTHKLALKSREWRKQLGGSKAGPGQELLTDVLARMKGDQGLNILDEKKHIQTDQVKECTFHPHVTEYKPKQQRRQRGNSCYVKAEEGDKDRCVELYKMARRQSKDAKVCRSHVQSPCVETEVERGAGIRASEGRTDIHAADLQVQQAGGQCGANTEPSDGAAESQGY